MILKDMAYRSSFAGVFIIVLTVIDASTSVPLQDDKDKVRLKIVGGQDAQEGKWPWQAMMFIKKENSPDKFDMCGATLIHRHWVVTAAHCVINYSKMKIYFGVWNVSSHTEKNRIVRIPKEIHVHPCYDDGRPIQDAGSNIALIKLNQPVDRFSPVCFDQPRNWRYLLSGKTLSGCVATGYGKQSSGKRARILQEVFFSHTSTTACRSYGSTIADNTVCAYDSQMSARDACSGDLGGPLVCPTTQYGCNGYFLLGVTIAGNTPCGGDITNNPGIYAAIDPNLDWLRNVMGNRKASSQRHSKPAFFCNPKIQIKLSNTDSESTANLRTESIPEEIV